MEPGPLERDLLTHQRSHRSEDVWNGEEAASICLTTRMHLMTLKRLPQPDSRVLQYIINAGFYTIYRMASTFRCNDALITALVERWRKETHTFHLAVGEATITLQDVSVLLGLPVDGLAVTGTANHDWNGVAHRLLGVIPGDGIVTGSSIRTRWLVEQTGELPLGADEHTVQCYARRYILICLHAVLFPDGTGVKVQMIYLPLLEDLQSAGRYSWGSALLAYLYRNLCKACTIGKKELPGCALLLQIWSWERMPIGRPRVVHIPREGDPVNARSRAYRAARYQPTENVMPPDFDSHFQAGVDALAARWMNISTSKSNADRSLEYYRDLFDRQRADQFEWEPYTPAIFEMLPAICRSSSYVWKSVCPLICFDIVEWHHPNRVLRQFGIPPQIPPNTVYDQTLHKLDRRGRGDEDWAARHHTFIEMWNDRAALVLNPYIPEHIPYDQWMIQYMAWYRKKTRLMISPTSEALIGVHEPVAPDLHTMINYATTVDYAWTQASQEAHQLHEQQQYGASIDRFDQYGRIIQQQQLQEQVRFNPPFNASSFGPQFSQGGGSSSNPQETGNYYDPQFSQGGGRHHPGHGDLHGGMDSDDE